MACMSCEAGYESTEDRHACKVLSQAPATGCLARNGAANRFVRLASMPLPLTSAASLVSLALLVKFEWTVEVLPLGSVR